MTVRALALASSIAVLCGCTSSDPAANRDTDPDGAPALSGIGAITSGSGSCSTVSSGAARCPAVPLLGVAPDASLPPGVPTEWNAWVGCSYMNCYVGSCTTCSCVATDGGAEWSCVDAGAPSSPSSGGPEVCAPGASAGAAPATSPNDPRCPSAWSDLTDSTGIPTVCTTNALICVYPQGQAECAADGTVLKWWQVGLGQGCSEYPPGQCSACSARGTVCNYISGLPSSLNGDYTTNYCCDGNTDRWERLPSGGCPNGNVCGTIKASDYDQTCTTDSDCTAVYEGDTCMPTCQCANAAVSMRAAAQYEADLEKKTSVSAACPCPFGGPPRCNAGTCQL